MQRVKKKNAILGSNKGLKLNYCTKYLEICHFKAKIIKFGQPLTDLKLLLLFCWEEDKKIFLEGTISPSSSSQH